MLESCFQWNAVPRLSASYFRTPCPLVPTPRTFLPTTMVKATRKTYGSVDCFKPGADELLLKGAPSLRNAWFRVGGDEAVRTNCGRQPLAAPGAPPRQEGQDASNGGQKQVQHTLWSLRAHTPLRGTGSHAPAQSLPTLVNEVVIFKLDRQASRRPTAACSRRRRRPRALAKARRRLTRSETSTSRAALAPWCGRGAADPDYPRGFCPHASACPARSTACRTSAASQHDALETVRRAVPAAVGAPLKPNTGLHDALAVSAWVCLTVVTKQTGDRPQKKREERQAAA